MPSRAKPRLTQTGKFNEQRRFEFIDRGRLRVSERSKRGNRSYVIDIIAIDPKSRSTMRIPWHWLKLAVVAAAVALVASLALESGGIVLILVLMGAGAVSVTGLVMAIRGTGKKLIFVSCHAHLPLLELELNQPDPMRFNNFIAYLKQRITDAHKERKLEKDQRVAGEMRMLRRLTEAGVFEPAVYQGAKCRLLEKF